MIKEHLKEYQLELKKCIKDLSNIKTIYKQVPNLLTFSRAIGMIPINILLFTGNTIPAVILTAIILSTDFFDGKLARCWNIQSKFGADLDAICDKVMFLGLSLPLIINNPVLIVNFILEGSISLVNVLGRLNGLNTKTVLSGKVKTWFLSLTLISGYLVQFFDLPVSILNILIGMTLGSQGLTLSSYIKEYRRLRNEKKQESINMIQEKTKIVEQENKEKENCPSNQKILIEELKKEQEFLLNMNEPDIFTVKNRSKNLIN